MNAKWKILGPVERAHLIIKFRAAAIFSIKSGITNICFHSDRLIHVDICHLLKGNFYLLNFHALD